MRLYYRTQRNLIENYNNEKSTNYNIPCAKIIGEVHNRKKTYRPTSIVNISAAAITDPVLTPMVPLFW